ncbi:MAG: hypothetical protein GXO63_01070 [Candidatus Micrarchaeota archaeon]|nr:hypothetical protein [Candidatus Micrarchaeota archaeon]
MKAATPITITVILIAFTMVTAAILAAFTSKYVSQERTPVCGGKIKFISGFPKYEDGTIKAVVEAEGSPVGNFVFEIILTNASVLRVPDVTGSVVSPGKLGTVMSSKIGVPKEKISQVRLLTNCTDVKTLLTAIP